MLWCIYSFNMSSTMAPSSIACANVDEVDWRGVGYVGQPAREAMVRPSTLARPLGPRGPACAIYLTLNCPHFVAKVRR